MTQLNREDLLSLEDYAQQRQDFRDKVMAHKKNRMIPVGPSVVMHFEDSLIMQYQIQEMLRIEKIFEADAIQEELDAYNPLIPNGSNWKATQMIEFPDPEERATELQKLIGIEEATYVKVGEHPVVYAIADEDLERSNDDKTSSVHFMRFELTNEMLLAVNQGVDIYVGIDMDYYRHETKLNAEQAASLINDLVLN